MTIMTMQREIVVGVDTHLDVHVAVALDTAGARLGERHATRQQARLRSLADLRAGLGRGPGRGRRRTGSYGAGLSGICGLRASTCARPTRPDRANRRRRGKTDAIGRRRGALACTVHVRPKTADGAVEQLRMLRVARRGAIKARTQACNQLKALRPFRDCARNGWPPRGWSRVVVDPTVRG